MHLQPLTDTTLLVFYKTRSSKTIPLAEFNETYKLLDWDEHPFDDPDEKLSA